MTTEPKFCLRREPATRHVTREVLEAHPTGQGDYYLAGRNTWPIRERIKSLGGRWDGASRRWYVTRDVASRLGATVLSKVQRAPVCCELHDDPDGTFYTMATAQEVMHGRVVVRFCQRCDSHIHEVVAIRDLISVEDLPELPSTPEAKPRNWLERPPWED